jgi:hypothetical protein
MKAFDADEGNNVGSHCFLRKKEIPPETWFARLLVGDRRVLFLPTPLLGSLLGKGPACRNRRWTNRRLPAGNKKGERIANERRAGFSAESKVAP